MMKMWTIRVYDTGGLKAKFRVDIDGYADNDWGGRVHSARGKGNSHAEAYANALSKLEQKPSIP